MGHLFPFHDYWWFYLAFTGMILVLLLLDLGIFHRKAHVVHFREATLWVAVWMSLALIFCFGLYEYTRVGLNLAPHVSRQVALEFLTGYVVEQSLSVDNMFVFVLIFRYFAIPARYQHRVLFYGILGALAFRAMFIALGAALLRYELVVWVFGGFLVVTGVKMCFGGEEEVEPEKNVVVRLLRRLLPVTAEFHGPRFFAKINGSTFATPLLLTLGMLEFTDLVFAVDSVPAIFAVTREPLIVFTSNIFAILGLRSMYFLLAAAVTKFHLLRYGLAVILVFVGLKMAVLNHFWGGKFPTGVSLTIIFVVLAVSIGLSLAFPKPESDPAAS
jgi:tellurite resistance protein TerC